MRSGLFSSVPLPLFLLVTLSLALVSVSAWPDHFGRLDTDHLWLTHLTLELASIFVSVSIVAILFQRVDETKSRFTNTIVFSFTTIALLDYIHSLSYQGMPIFITESSTEKAIFFWLSSRTLELMAMVAISFHFKLHGHKLIWLSAAMLLAAVICYVGLYHLDSFPATFIPGTGVTQFKTNFEYVLFIGNSVLALIFLQQYKHSHRGQYLYFAGSCYAMALCALTLTNYATPSDYSLLIGHLFKILSAVFIYRAIYWTELKRPYQLARLAEAKIHKKDAELNAILSNIPLGIMRFDSSFNYLYINPYMQSMSHIFDTPQIGRNIRDSLPKEVLELMLTHLEQTLSGHKVEFQFEYTYSNGTTVHRQVIMVPEKNTEDKIETLLCLVVDTTEKETAERIKLAALQETEKLRKALDEHAIVAFTDAKGVITSVNSKFCEISQYSRDELVGNTHQLINSKVHPPCFFKQMWKTIATGKIWHGEICNKAKDGSLYWVNTTIVPYVDKNGKPTHYIAIRADITERKFAEQEAQRLAYYDELTSLPNRRLLKEKLEKIFSNASSLTPAINALLLIDLDNFKDINDSLGHTAGDELLKQVGSRLQQQTGLTQTAARLGGDEFVLLMTGVEQTKSNASIKVAAQAEQIRAALSEPYLLDGQSLNITPSIGVALFDCSEHDASEFLKQADIAMYQSKAHGKNQVSFFDPELQAELNKRNEMLRELSLATHQHEFMLFYQPIYNKNKTTVGSEALIRWNSKTLGMVSPAQFIPLAEQSNLILDIGNWVLHTACKQLFRWSLDECRSAWTVAVNVSARQLQQPNFVETVKMTLKEHGANPYRLKLEITESMLQVNVDETIKAMKELRTLGIRFSLDDFGTGYSSLNYLTKLPIDTLKIDRSFVENMINSQEDAAVVATILSLASTLKLEVVAEGVETEEQLEFLIKSGCQSFQGYLLGRPMPADQLRNGC
ncbi:bifunctional diguanylate cyclase/phosphodiesterase [Rheinheimera tangshanensis]|uniref:EAL domain-containing protein n=1 Tax=Rheinheimera tangshanensis TaxID=400153 RepID=A0A5C8LXF5_9GAMM|nr:EAL domain-containing protein [Rheinheimera tangshanensis]TXK81971.1 EAL domain-containing protein [Rheinheimera tangshanensis]